MEASITEAAHHPCRLQDPWKSVLPRSSAHSYGRLPQEKGCRWIGSNDVIIAATLCADECAEQQTPDDASRNLELSLATFTSSQPQLVVSSPQLPDCSHQAQQRSTFEIIYCSSSKSSHVYPRIGQCRYRSFPLRQCLELMPFLSRSMRTPSVWRPMNQEVSEAPKNPNNHELLQVPRSGISSEAS